jgi:predicted GNAT family acetyltransferase
MFNNIRGAVVRVRTYEDAQIFLQRTRAELESNEAANNLMLGISGQLVQSPERFKLAPCLKTVEDKDGLVLAALMTPPHKLIVYGHQGDLEGAARMLVKELVAEGWPVPGVFGPSQAASRVAERWAQVTSQGYELERRQGVYELRQVASSPPGRGRLRLATEADTDLVTRWWCEFYLGIFGEVDQEQAGRSAQSQIERGDVYLWQDERPVSMAIKTRPTTNGISLSLVYTPPEWRGRGYATACVGELSRSLLGEGWAFCALFVDLANEAANRVYQKAGYKSVCDYDEYVFLEEG